jgi:RNA polymerase sigma factor (sigma-70 family)
MKDVADMELLRQYVRLNSDEAFAALVSRHLNMVYSAALRKTGNAHAAEEITQAVFIILAKKADHLRAGTILSGWLYQTARLTSSGFLRTEIRRAHREQEAYMQSLTDESGTDIWPEIEPLLDDAMGRLGEKDRNAITLRYFEGKNFQEIGVAFGTSENAAKKRVGHALEKLRKSFAKRGVNSTSAIISVAISANSVQAAPVALAKAVTVVAIAKGAAASGSILTLVKGALKIMAWTNLKPFIAVGAAIILATQTTMLVAQNQMLSNSVITTNSITPAKIKTGTIPYKMVDAAFQLADFAGVDRTKLTVPIFVAVDNKVPRPEDINLTIQSASKGLITLQFDERGQILNFPQNEQLRRENPNIMMKIHGEELVFRSKYNVPLPENLTFPYRRLGDAVAEANKLNKYINEHTPSKDHQRLVQGFFFNFPKSSAGKATLVIAAASGKREYSAKASGNYLKLDQTLLKENPDVTVSEMPLSISLY